MNLKRTNIYQTIKTILQTARDNAYRQVNFIMVEATFVDCQKRIKTEHSDFYLELEMNKK